MAFECYPKTQNVFRMYPQNVFFNNWIQKVGEYQYGDFVFINHIYKKMFNNVFQKMQIFSYETINILHIYNYFIIIIHLQYTSVKLIQIIFKCNDNI